MKRLRMMVREDTVDSRGRRLRTIARQTKRAQMGSDSIFRMGSDSIEKMEADPICADMSPSARLGFGGAVLSLISSAPPPPHGCAAEPRSRDWLEPSQLVLPLFVRLGEGVRQPVESMPGVSPDVGGRDAARCDATRRSAGSAACCCSASRTTRTRRVRARGTTKGRCSRRCARSSASCRSSSSSPTSACASTPIHGHCGVFARTATSTTTRTLELLAREAVSHARAGADIVAPSDMMDGRVGGDSRARSTTTGFGDTSILSYAAKFAAAVLRPVPRGGREHAAVRRPARLSDGPANVDEALRESGSTSRRAPTW